MFAYVKFEDGHKMIVKTSDIKHFKAECVNRSKKYKVRWEDDTFYDALIIDVGDCKQKLEEKLASKRPQILLFDKCQSTSESELESSINDKANITDKIEKRLIRINSDCTSKKENMNVITKKDIKEVKKKNVTKITSKAILKTNNNIFPSMDQNIEGKNEFTKKVPAATKTTISMEKKNITTNKCNETTKVIDNKNDTIKKNQLHVEALKKQIRDFKSQNDFLCSENIQLKKTIKDKENVLNDVMGLNVSLQKHIIDDFDELKAIVVDLCKKNAEKEHTNPGELPVGYRSVEKNLMYLGHDVWITNCQYDSISAISKSCAMFVKNMAIAIFGTAVLRSSSVTGTQSNRIKNKTKKEPRPKLDPAKLLAVRDTLRYWLSNEKRYDEVAIEFELQQVGTHISHKIYELNRVSDGKRAVHNHPDVTEVGVTDNNNGSVAQYCETDSSIDKDDNHELDKGEKDYDLLNRSENETNTETSMDDEKVEESVENSKEEERTL